MKTIGIAVALVSLFAVTLVGWGGAQEKIKSNCKDIAKVEEHIEKIDEYIVEQRMFNVEIKMGIKNILEKLEN